MSNKTCSIYLAIIWYYMNEGTKGIKESKTLKVIALSKNEANEIITSNRMKLGDNFIKGVILKLSGNEIIKTVYSLK